MTILADDALLDHAIINLLRNAADAAASSREPRVWLDARLSERGRWTADYVRLRVAATKP